MACFPLVPFSNRVRDGRFTFEGTSVQLSPNFPPEPHAIHGHGWQREWEVEEQTDSSLITGFTYDGNDPVSSDATATKGRGDRVAEWPWTYRARQHYSLTSEVLEVTISVTNTSDAAMPVGLGLHPYFVRTPGSRLETGVDGVWKSDENSMPSELVNVPPDWDLNGLDPDRVSLDNNFTGWSREALIDWPDRNASLTLTADDLFDFLVVYTPPGEDFFCVEPVSNTLDAFNLREQGRDDVGGSVVEPGETLSGAIRFAPDVNK
jgi:aldose 1-epimerase